jgi:cysteine sulfinate desulfinase/cysteine desulfurase-like protein
LVLSLGIENTDEDVDLLVKEFPPLVKKLREMSPYYQEMRAKEKNRMESKKK